MRFPRLLAASAAAIALAFGSVPGATGASAQATPAPAPTAAATTWAVAPADASAPDGRRWIERTLDPGASVQEHMAVSNYGTEAVTFRLTAADGYFTENGRFSMKTSGVPSTEAGTWISIPAEVAVEPGATAIVPFTVTVPASAAPGDHAAGVAASIFGRGDGGTGVTTESRVGFRVMVRVAGELRPSAVIESVTGSYQTQWNPFRPGRIDVRYGVRNDGNVQLAVTGGSRAGAAVGSEPLTDREILADADLAATDRVLGVWPLGPVELAVTVTGQPKGADGKPDPAAAPIEVRKTITVWAVPWPQLIVLAAAVLVVLGLVWRRRGSRRRLESMLAEARAEGARSAGEDRLDR